MRGEIGLIAIEAAQHADIPDVAAIAAAHTYDSPAAAWCVPDIRDRPGVFMAWYSIVLEQAINHGHVDVSWTKWGAAIWLDPTATRPPQARWHHRVRAACGPYAGTMLRYEHHLDLHRPRFGHLRLVALAATPQPAAALLAHRHRALDRAGTSAYTVAHSPDHRETLLAAGYAQSCRRRLPGGPEVWPLHRRPRLRRDGAATAGS